MPPAFSCANAMPCVERSKQERPRVFSWEVSQLVQVNGEKKDIAGQTVAAYLRAAGYDRARIAVECNGAIVKQAEYDSTVLADGDTVEIVRFVGGG